MGLQAEIDAKAKEIHTDGYPMSIGEFISLYHNKEIEIRPEFQRYFRWTDLQKTKLIESILLGIPIPSIFVSQRDDGVWDVIDGLQRLSTILEFVGELRKENDELYSPSRLMGTTYLPSLENKAWKELDSEGNETENSFDQSQRLAIKRAKLDFKIIKKESDTETKFELFQRLNTGGTPLTPQEVRNCILVMINREFFEWVIRLSENESFLSCISLSDKLIEEQYHVELFLRFLAYKNSSIDDIKKSKDVGEFLTSRMIDFCQEGNLDKDREESVFLKTFGLLDQVLSDESFKRYDFQKQRFMGSFLISAFEVIAIGMGTHIDTWEYSKENAEVIRAKIKNLWQNDTFRTYSGSGSRASSRLPHLLPLGKSVFGNEN
ncbi:DUF262 domain-containing protein [Metallumcola ferriviriculae]|uniref:DUF262 domain-containing protein n=1 Tax=Metallumcola ferriviriculae TaxID=3039180 RepID=A0AAU0UJ76_9FIRM|nr:DUF262 domain-containing protein [Desulfitibacteraceae bacterium MK1]